MDFDAKAFLRSVTDQPGVYQMLNANDDVIYVGKAKSLKKRLSSYFRTNVDSAKTRALVKHIANIQVTVTHTEAEALILENNLIKRFRPRYNVLLRDDKSYPYLLISNHKHPRLAFHRGAKKSHGEYFGPFPSGGAVRESLNLLQKLFQVRQCDDTTYRSRSRPCLQYQLGRCTAPCVQGHVTDEQYAKQVDQTRLFLKGNSEKVIAQLVTDMEQASAELEFEMAATLRDRITALRQVQVQHSVEAGKDAIDVIGLAVNGNQCCVHLQFIRDGKLLGSKSLYPSIPADTDTQELLSSILTQFYGAEGRSGQVPSAILLPFKLENTDELTNDLQLLTERKIKLVFQPRGDRARFLKLAQTNAETALESRLAHKQSIQQRLHQLTETLALDTIPKRIECFDISHTSGQQTVASCVVFNQEGPHKSEYRRYNIAGITPGDDYAAMKQALQRRFKQLGAESKVPDLLLIDGGLGQLGMAEEVMAELDWSEAPLKPLLVGVAKGESRKPGLETLILGDSHQAFNLPVDSPALLLIQQVRDEAHRFAITGHRERRRKNAKRSTLEDIPGIGASRRQALISHLGGMQQVKAASVEELAKVPGISAKMAQTIHDSLQE
ncbi:excinuclease ABC subunit UvrC [Corallincola platygyrae]|uniref:UvrABC system protein C n=1 Tax=Corallincola platygyrae TaxID=1193278 RepID=A0ABW4XHV8_9GAMM